jgi:hypothetical protein
MRPDHDHMDDVTSAEPEEGMDGMSSETERHMEDMTGAEPQDHMDEVHRPNPEDESGAQA